VAEEEIAGNWAEHGIRIDRGRARINVVEVHHDAPDFVAIEIDMTSKYIQPILAYGDPGESTEVHLWEGERGLDLDLSTEAMTVLHLPAREGDWVVVGNGGRYTIQLAMWRRPEKEDPGEWTPT
jgi:hypothetical protein